MRYLPQVQNLTGYEKNSVMKINYNLMQYLKNSDRQTMAPRASCVSSVVLWTTHPVSFLSRDLLTLTPSPTPAKPPSIPSQGPGREGRGRAGQPRAERLPESPRTEPGLFATWHPAAPSGGGRGRESEKGPRAFQRQDLARARGR